MTDKSREYYRKRNATMVAEYETEGLSIPEIAEKHGLKIQMAYLVVSKGKGYIERAEKRKEGVAISHMALIRAGFRKEREKIYWLYQHGYGADEIAERYGMKISHVYNVAYQIRINANEKADWKNSCIPVEIIDREKGKVIAAYKSVREASEAMYFNYSGICKALKAYPEPISGWFGEKYLARKAEANAGKLCLLSEEEIDRMMEEERRNKER